MDPVIQVSTEGPILCISAAGLLERENLIRVVRENYPACSCRLCLWDLRHADVSKLVPADLGAIAMAVQATVPRDGGRKTAFCVGDPASYTKTCAYLNHATQARVASEYAVFLDLEKAKRWLMQ